MINALLVGAVIGLDLAIAWLIGRWIAAATREPTTYDWHRELTAAGRTRTEAR